MCFSLLWLIKHLYYPRITSNVFVNLLLGVNLASFYLDHNDLRNLFSLFAGLNFAVLVARRYIQGRVLGSFVLIPRYLISDGGFRNYHYQCLEDYLKDLFSFPFGRFSFLLTQNASVTSTTA